MNTVDIALKAGLFLIWPVIAAIVLTILAVACVAIAIGLLVFWLAIPFAEISYQDGGINVDRIVEKLL